MMKTIVLAIAACTFAAAAWAQDASQLLNLKLPANMPSTSSTAAAPATPVATANGTGTPGKPVASAPAQTANQATAGNTASNPATPNAKTPGVYYGDTSGAPGDTQAAMSQPAAPACDDATYNQPQVHGSVGMGVVSAGRYGSGSYTGGAVNVSQAFGSCEHPSGGVSISIGGTRFNGH